jgi:hypothetical protein
MSGIQKTLAGSTGALLLAFVVHGILTWIRVLQVIQYSSSCATTLIQITQESATVRPFFVGAFTLCMAAFEFSRRGLPKGLRFAWLFTLGFGAALLVMPWIVAMIHV